VDVFGGSAMSRMPDPTAEPALAIIREHYSAAKESAAKFSRELDDISKEMDVLRANADALVQSLKQAETEKRAFERILQRLGLPVV